MTTRDERKDRMAAVLTHIIENDGEIPEGDQQKLASLFDVDRTQIYRDKEKLKQLV